MRKLEKFNRYFETLKDADFELARTNPIYRLGVIEQFNLTFEFACKALQAVLKEHGVADAKAASPRNILKLAYRVGFLEDPDTWLEMLGRQNQSARLYNEFRLNKMLDLIQNDFIPALAKLDETLKIQHEQAQGGLE